MVWTFGATFLLIFSILFSLVLFEGLHVCYHLCCCRTNRRLSCIHPELCCVHLCCFRRSLSPSKFYSPGKSLTLLHFVSSEFLTVQSYLKQQGNQVKITWNTFSALELTNIFVLVYVCIEISQTVSRSRGQYQTSIPLKYYTSSHSQFPPINCWNNKSLNILVEGVGSETDEAFTVKYGVEKILQKHSTIHHHVSRGKI